MPAHSEQLAVVEEFQTPKEFPYFLNALEEIAHSKEHFGSNSPYIVRIWRIRMVSPAECDGSPERCPKYNLYIAVSGYDEYPEMTVFLLPEAYGYEFVEWVKAPYEEGKENFLFFKIKQKIIAKNIEEGWWEETTLKVAVNPWMGKFEKEQ